MDSDAVRVEFDRAKVASTGAVLLGAIAAVWLFPWVFRDYPYFSTEPDGLSDVLWLPAAIGSAVLASMVARLFVHVASGHPAVLLVPNRLTGFRIGQVNPSDVTDIVWRGSPQRGWPGDRLEIRLAQGPRKTIQTRLFRDSDLPLMLQIAAELRDHTLPGGQAPSR